MAGPMLLFRGMFFGVVAMCLMGIGGRGLIETAIRQTVVAILVGLVFSEIRILDVIISLYLGLVVGVRLQDDGGVVDGNVKTVIDSIAINPAKAFKTLSILLDSPAPRIEIFKTHLPLLLSHCTTVLTLYTTSLKTHSGTYTWFM